MYSIERKDYGFKLTFGGFMSYGEMAKWARDSENILSDIKNKFGVFIDMRKLEPLPPDAKLEMERGQKMYKAAGMEKSVVILDDLLIALQFKKIAKESGIHKWERYIVSSKEPQWEKKGLDWIIEGLDPDSE